MSVATLLISISMILMIMALHNNSQIRLQINLPTTKDTDLKFLSPFVTFMALDGKGYLFTLKQNTDSSFQFEWELKLPKVPNLGLNTGILGGPGVNTGYFVFNDRKAVFVISTNSKQKMTMINGPDQHVTLARSHIIDNFYIFGSILRVGNFVMVFGGFDGLLTDSMDSGGCTLTTALWSIKRQHWIHGPLLPPKIVGCSSILTCTTYFDKFSKLYGDIFHFLIIKKSSMYHDFCRKVLILWYELDDYKHFRTFLLDYPSMEVKQLKDPTMLKGKQNCIIVLARGFYLATSEFTKSLFSRWSSSENHKSFIFSLELQT